jgi:hypothetical protein
MELVFSYFRRWGGSFNSDACCFDLLGEGFPLGAKVARISRSFMISTRERQPSARAKHLFRE